LTEKVAGGDTDALIAVLGRIACKIASAAPTDGPASRVRVCFEAGCDGFWLARFLIDRPVEVHAYADRVVVKQDGTVIAEHRRSFGRGETVYDPWHYVPVLPRKPGALRNGAPFRDWVMPAAMEKVRKRLKAADDGDRQVVTILGCVPGDGITAVEAACQEALDQGVCSAAVILNILARRRDPAPTARLQIPDALRLTHEPVADCARYDSLRRVS
jgi:hypothetical protein